MARKARAAAGPLFEVVMECMQAYFALRTMGQGLGVATESGASSWGLLRLLDLHGPMTVPAVAERRGVSRQYIQKLADALAASGALEFAENPAHARSRLMRLTPKGRRAYSAMTARIHETLASIAHGFSARELETAREVLSRLRGRVAG